MTMVIPWRLDAVTSDQRQELFPRLCVLAEATEHGAGNSLTTGLLNTAHYHAEMAI